MPIVLDTNLEDIPLFSSFKIRLTPNIMVEEPRLKFSTGWIKLFHHLNTQNTLKKEERKLNYKKLLRKLKLLKNKFSSKRNLKGTQTKRAVELWSLLLRNLLKVTAIHSPLS